MKTPFAKELLFLSSLLKTVVIGLAFCAVIPLLQAQVRIPANHAAPPGTVNTNAAGFRVKVVQATHPPTLANTVARAEAQLAGTLIDPLTGAPYLNSALSGPNADGTYDIQTVVNWNQNTDPSIPTVGNAGNFIPDDQVPGIPGSDPFNLNNNIAAEVLTFLDLLAGTNRFGVNSDDGFRLAIGVGTSTKDAFATEVGIFDAGRGAADSQFEFVVDQAGVYPARLIWFEGDGDANLEFFSMNPPTTAGTRILINNRTNIAGVKAYRELLSGAAKPYATTVEPAPNAAGVSARPRILVELLDQTTGVDTNTISLTVNGTVASPAITKSGAVTRILHLVASLLPPGSTNSATLTYSDNGSPATSFTRTWQFVVANYATIPTAYALPSGSGNASAPGFKVKVVQGPATPIFANSAPRAEAQLASTLRNPSTGIPYPNEANPGPNPDGTFDDADVVNYEQESGLGVGGPQGNFTPDEAIPGIPGTTVHTDNIAAEIVTYLELTADAHTFGVNSDDGFVVSAGPDVGDVFGSVLGRFDGGRGAADTIFHFVAPASGVYPFRLIWYEGGGGANVEWFSVDTATGQKTLINNTTNAAAVRAFREVTPATQTKPHVETVNPVLGATSVPVTTTIDYTLIDGVIQVVTNSIQLFLNGQSVLPSIVKSGATTTVSFDPPGNLAGSSNYTVRLVFNDNATPANTRDLTMSFATERLPITLPPIQQEAGGLAVIEAENFDTNAPGLTHIWEFAMTPAGYTGDGTMYSLPESGVTIAQPQALTDSPRLSYKVSFVKTGTHYFWFRGSDGGGNSLHAGIDDVDPSFTTLDNMDDFAACCGTRAPGGTSWVWVGGIDATAAGRAIFDVATPGVHTIHIWMREDGQIVDKLLITTNASYTPTGAGPPESRRVGQAPPPSVSITSPTNDATFPAGGNITITATASDTDGTIAKVEFFDGTNKLGEATSSPYSITLTNVATGRYTLSAKATDNSGDSGTSAIVRIKVGTPPPLALFVVSTVPPNASDSAVHSRLLSLGLEVELIDDNLTAPTDADGKDLIVISSTVGSGNVNIKYRDSTVPILNWEPALYDDLGMAAAAGAGIAAQTQLDIANASHPLAAGLPAGLTTVFTSPQLVVSVLPEASAVIVATAADGSATPAIFAFETGAALFGGLTATARRVGFFLENNNAPLLTADGLKLFDAAVNWAMDRSTVPPPRFNPPTISAGNVTLSWTGTGTLEQTDSLSPPNWTTAPNQANQQTVPVVGGSRFYRIRR